MPKLPVPVPPADDIDYTRDDRFLFAVPARRPTEAAASPRGVTQSWFAAVEAVLPTPAPLAA